jgi:hypothetical protein
VLDPSGSSALSLSGGSVAQVNCGVVVNSSSGTAFTISGGSRLVATGISIAGNYSTSGGSTISPPPTIHAAAETDPLASIAPPAVGGCTRTNYGLSGGASDILSEGVYCNGISLSGGSTLRLNPGTYVLKGGGLKVSGGSTLIGSGVAFYNTSGGGYSYDGISISGGGTIQLRAPTSGNLAGILFFQDRSVASGPSSSVTGGATSYFIGALYFPSTLLTYSGGTDTEYTIIVASRLNLSGGTTLNNDYTSLTDGPPVKGYAALSE